LTVSSSDSKESEDKTLFPKSSPGCEKSSLGEGRDESCDISDIVYGIKYINE
jgi:hypothetical protein